MARIRAITADEVRPLRQRILRPHQRESALVYAGDAAPDTLHAGAFEDGELVGIASIFLEPPEYNVTHPAAWRLRGMATLPEYRGKGLGRLLLTACLRHASAEGGRLAWCNARVSAIGFYRRLGFEQLGAVFELPAIGPHVLMERPLQGFSAADRVFMQG
ncbi:MAG: GNAT family N-acetyltransferase [Myxococcales bacterium]|nr:GNAT family N-acetyltransferase [Myxococcales bacterium]MCB9546872.1 GNAT family N-acetyltransferase [Myxococcales bacterium]